MDASLRNFVRQRAQHRCEYCHVRQEYEPFYRFHIEHIIPPQLGGDDETNLALACHHCNLNKAANLTAVDPDSSQPVPLFHPRQQSWAEHFTLRDFAIVGLTPTGRATAALLKMNAVARLELQRETQI